MYMPEQRYSANDRSPITTKVTCTARESNLVRPIRHIKLTGLMIEHMSENHNQFNKYPLMYNYNQIRIKVNQNFLPTTVR
jgi:hypothetical protein